MATNERNTNVQSKVEKNNTKKLKDAYIFVSFGLVVILISIILGGIHNASVVGIQFLSHLGIGLLLIGILGIVLDFNNWKDYFEKRLSNIVINKTYLEKLDKKHLIDLQTDVLKAYYKNDNIGGADGFLDFYQNNIQSFVSIPFRNNANLNLQIDYLKDNSDKFCIQETMSWICKSNGGKIQKAASWIPGENEFEKVNSFDIKIQHKNLATAANPTGEILFDFETLKKEHSVGTLGFSLPLDSYVDMDELYIVLKINYIIPKERFMGWRMSLPTRRMSLTVQFPKGLELISEFYFNENNVFHCEKNTGTGYYYLSIEDWIMPDEGISIQLISPPLRKEEIALLNEK